MKYSINGFSQAEITNFNDAHLEYQIDPVDLLIFAWLKDFIVDTEVSAIENKNKKKMWTKEFDGTRYYCVRYSAIIEEFPILNYQSQKTISRRFEKYVKSGILLKRTISGGKGKGFYTFFALTPVFQSFYTDKNNPTQRVNPHNQKKEVKNIQNGDYTIDKTVQCIGYREDKNVQCNDTKDKNVQCIGYTKDKNVQCIIVNSTTNMNSTTTAISNQSNQNNLQKQKTAAAVYSETLQKLFGYNPNFSPDPFPILLDKFKTYNISFDLIADYLTWSFNQVESKCKNKNALAGYYFKSFTQDPYLSNFSDIKVIKNIEFIQCPVCKNKYDSKITECPTCGFSQLNISDKNEIQNASKIY